MARVTGVGGVFLRTKDPRATAKWYAEYLGVVLNDFNGSAFQWSDEVPKGTGMTVWSAFPEGTEYFGEGSQPFMVNYRVDDLDTLLASLESAGVWVDPKRDDLSYGKFGWIRDCDGYRVELWQPLADEPQTA